ncbi:ATP-binding protein [Muricauda ruestringensis]|uniref:AAA family ATPase n=1 Tax=Flagellimonas ruestringensis TaxID=111501 RepID=UPI001CD4E43F|nr:AAA family ATPase [Allomuricauda ruestringensis]MCA0960209.1 ATP-binding protein [Allomuricauda ruestringensis]
MEILALYIDNHFLYENPVALNFGGSVIFDFLTENDKLRITKEENDQFIKGFFGSGISNISAIVGNNGVGKTSLIRVLNQEPKVKCLAIYGDDENLYIQNSLELSVNAEFEFEDIESEKCPFPLYYSNIIDYNLQEFNSPISESNLYKNNLVEYYYDTIIRQVFLLNNKGEVLSEKFPELPYFKEVSISINNPTKTQFLEPDFYSKATIGKSIQDQLKMLWDSYGNGSTMTIHQNEDFLKDFEIFILSLLVTDDTFARTNSNGFSVDFKDVLHQEDFRNKLEWFLRKRLDNIDAPLFEGLEKSYGISFENIDDLIEKIRNDKISQIAGGFDFNRIKNHAVLIILRYDAIFRLYDFVERNYKMFEYSSDKSIITYSVSDEKTEGLLKELFMLYQKVYESIQYIRFEYRIFNISPSRKLSTGELALLNFFSSIYKFTLRKEGRFQKKKNYLLLLDEPDHGFHASWKKKFISSLINLIPELFSELKQNPDVQIIFTTHDPLTLSDIPNNNISYLKRIDENEIRVFGIGTSDRPSKSFGANITDLLADSFFVDNGLIGDFAKEKIQETIKWLNNPERDLEKREYYRKVILIVDEPIVQRKLSEMYDEIFENDLELSVINQQIKLLVDLRDRKKSGQ